MPAARARRTARGRAPLTRERVLRAAIALADKGGVDSLTMRTLAKKLGVEAMSLYSHVANKDDLLGGMVDIVFGEIDFPSDGADWKAAMRERAISTRAALSRHRWAIGLMEARPNPGPENLRVHDAVLGCLRQAGFSAAMTVQASSAQDAYIYGFALQERTLGFETHESTAAAQRSIRGYESELSKYPYLAEIVAGYVAEEGYDFDAAFLFGLDLILDGLDRFRAEAPREPPA